MACQLRMDVRDEAGKHVFRVALAIVIEPSQSGFNWRQPNECGQKRVNPVAQLLRPMTQEAAMKHSPFGNSLPKTDTVARAIAILKDRPMPQQKAAQRKNFIRTYGKPAPKPA